MSPSFTLNSPEIFDAHVGAPAEEALDDLLVGLHRGEVQRGVALQRVLVVDDPRHLRLELPVGRVRLPLQEHLDALGVGGVPRITAVLALGRVAQEYLVEDGLP